MWNNGFNYGHGTGHGIGHVLSVHEGPQKISPLPLDIRIEPGMLISDEPGLYREGFYGIRLENILLCRRDFVNQWGIFNRFETLTFYPFEEDLINFSTMTPDEIEWLKWYYGEIGNKFLQRLKDPVKDWLMNKLKKVENA